jgi:hypothetical protein
MQKKFAFCKATCIKPGIIDRRLRTKAGSQRLVNHGTNLAAQD